jgi:uncharacterized protein YdgA (DUF945 family)
MPNLSLVIVGVAAALALVSLGGGFYEFLGRAIRKASLR